MQNRQVERKRDPANLDRNKSRTQMHADRITLEESRKGCVDLVDIKSGIETGPQINVSRERDIKISINNLELLLRDNPNTGNN